MKDKATVNIYLGKNGTDIDIETYCTDNNQLIALLEETVKRLKAKGGN